MDYSPLQIAHQKVFFQSAEKMSDIADETITLVITSPPYWNVRDYGYQDQIGFQQSYNEYIQSLNQVWKECIRVLQPNGKICINVQPLPIASDQSGYNRRIIKNIMNDIENFMYSQDMFLSGMIYWDKSPYINTVSWGSYPKPTNIAVNTAFEQIFTFVKRGKTRPIDANLQAESELTKHEWRHWAVRMIWDDISPVIKINQYGENLVGHGAPFPEDIPYRLIRMHTIKKEKVLDPFLGSGTTLKICRITDRQGFGYEINPEFRKLIKTRIEEEWNPPYIDAHYKTYSSQEIASIISQSIKTTLHTVETHFKPFQEQRAKRSYEVENLKKDIYQRCFSEILVQLKKKGILSDANVKRIKKNVNDDKST